MKPRELNQKIQKFLKLVRTLDEFKQIEFIFLYGSTANGNSNKLSDIDICIYFKGTEEESYNFRLKILSMVDGFDIQIFQQLPVYVQKEVLAGKALHTKNPSFIYDIALKTIQEFESFKPLYHDYIKRGK